MYLCFYSTLKGQTVECVRFGPGSVPCGSMNSNYSWPHKKLQRKTRVLTLTQVYEGSPTLYQKPWYYLKQTHKIPADANRNDNSQILIVCIKSVIKVMQLVSSNDLKAPGRPTHKGSDFNFCFSVDEIIGIHVAQFWTERTVKRKTVALCAKIPLHLLGNSILCKKKKKCSIIFLN